MARELTPRDRELIRRRIEFVRSKPDLDPAEARKRFFVQTRAQELKAAGKDVDRKALRQQFESGKVKRQGFYTEGDLKRIASRSKGGGSDAPDTSTAPTPRKTQQEMLDIRRKAYTGPKTTTTTSRSTAAPAAPTSGGGSFVNRFVQGIKDLGSAEEWKKGFKFVGDQAYSIPESFSATFVNPTINTVGRAIGKNPNLRQAGPLESALNVADVGITAATFGVGRGVTIPLKAALLRKYGNTAVGRGVTSVTSKIPGRKVTIPDRITPGPRPTPPGNPSVGPVRIGSQNYVSRTPAKNPRPTTTTTRPTAPGNPTRNPTAPGAASRTAELRSSQSGTAWRGQQVSRTSGPGDVYKKRVPRSSKNAQPKIVEPQKTVVVARRKDTPEGRLAFVQARKPVQSDLSEDFTWSALRGGGQDAVEMRGLMADVGKDKDGFWRWYGQKDYGLTISTGRAPQKKAATKPKSAAAKPAKTTGRSKSLETDPQVIVKDPSAPGGSRTVAGGKGRGTGRARKSTKGTEAKQASAPVKPKESVIETVPAQTQTKVTRKSTKGTAKPSKASDDIAAARREMEAEGFDYGDGLDDGSSLVRGAEPANDVIPTAAPAKKTTQTKSKAREGYERRQQKKVEKAAETTPAVGSKAQPTTRQAADAGARGTGRQRKSLDDIRRDSMGTPEQREVAALRRSVKESTEQVASQSAEQTAQSARGTGRSVSQIREESKKAEAALKAQQAAAEIPRNAPGRNRATEGIDWADIALNDAAQDSEVLGVLRAVKIGSADIYEAEWMKGIGRNLLARAEGIVASTDPARRRAAGEALSSFQKRNAKVLKEVMRREGDRATLAKEVMDARRFDTKVTRRFQRELKRAGGPTTPQGKRIIRRYNEMRRGRAKAGETNPAYRGYTEYIRIMGQD